MGIGGNVLENRSFCGLSRKSNFAYGRYVEWMTQELLVRIPAGTFPTVSAMSCRRGVSIHVG